MGKSARLPAVPGLQAGHDDRAGREIDVEPEVITVLYVQSDGLAAEPVDAACPRARSHRHHERKREPALSPHSARAAGARNPFDEGVSDVSGLGVSDVPGCTWWAHQGVHAALGRRTFRPERESLLACEDTHPAVASGANRERSRDAVRKAHPHVERRASDLVRCEVPVRVVYAGPEANFPPL